jgi:hypothetical protein
MSATHSRWLRSNGQPSAFDHLGSGDLHDTAAPMLQGCAPAILLRTAGPNFTLGSSEGLLLRNNWERTQSADCICSPASQVICLPLSRLNGTPRTGKFIERVPGTRNSERNSTAEFALHIPRSFNSSAKSTEQIRRKNAVNPAT